MTGRHKQLPTSIVARDAHLVQLENVPGWIVEANIRPCRQCGGTVFAVGHWRLGCVQCTQRYRDEEISGAVDLRELCQR